MRKTFTTICQMSQKKLKQYVEKELRETYSQVYVGDGYVFAQGEFPVLLVAHLDTVHTRLPQMITYDEQKEVISSPQGIGGDDRCGVYMILDIIKKYHCSVLFCEDEEIGAIGAEKFTQTALAQYLEFNYIIEFDRKGSNDAVFYDCANPDFEDFITQEFFESSWGSFSDISTLAPFLKCAAVNLSCGYYNAHTKKEYVVLPEMQKVIDEACKILERTTENDKFEYIEAKRNYYSKTYDWYDDYDYGYGYSEQEFYYMFEYVDENGKTEWYETIATNKAQAVGNFCMENPNVTYNDIIDFYVDAVMMNEGVVR